MLNISTTQLSAARHRRHRVVIALPMGLRPGGSASARGVGRTYHCLPTSGKLNQAKRCLTRWGYKPPSPLPASLPFASSSVRVPRTTPSSACLLIHSPCLSPHLCFCLPTSPVLKPPAPTEVRLAFVYVRACFVRIAISPLLSCSLVFGLFFPRSNKKPREFDTEGKEDSAITGCAVSCSHLHWAKCTVERSTAPFS